MLTIYTAGPGGLKRRPWPEGDPDPGPAVWIDAAAPTTDEVRAVERAVGVRLPGRREVEEIEPSSRIYRRGEASFLTFPMVWKVDSGAPELTPITLVRTPQCLVTLRDAEPQFLIDFAHAATRREELAGGPDALLLALVDAAVDRLADVLERVGADLSETSRDIFSSRATLSAKTQPIPVDLEEVVLRLGRLEDLNSLVQESLAGLARILTVLGMLFGEAPAAKALRPQVKTQARDVASLTEHSTSLHEKAAFLLDATLGLLSIQQTKITKIMSVVAAAFLPPTLLASIWGMNFMLMPELDWTLGYPLALALIVLSMIIPYRYFKRKGWL